MSTVLESISCAQIIPVLMSQQMQRHFLHNLFFKKVPIEMSEFLGGYIHDSEKVHS